jgi:hypothetical protein
MVEVKRMTGYAENNMKELRKVADKLNPILKPDKLYPASLTEMDGAVLFLIKRDGKKLLVAAAAENGDKANIGKFEGEEITHQGYAVKTCPLNSANAASLRELCPFLKPVAIGSKTAFGLGDRLGNATPGHIRAVRKFEVVPVFAQQSVREMSRTGSTPRQVMDYAAWAVFQEHYTSTFGADADHLKTEGDIKETSEAGFTMFTIDTSDYINDDAVRLAPEQLEEAFSRLFSSDDEKQEFMDAYLHSEFPLQISFSEEEIKREACKYLSALRRIIELYRYLSQLRGKCRFDFEVSIDETDVPTSPKDHLFIVTQLSNHGVGITGLAPRFTGEFQKAIDYIGDTEKFAEELKQHTAIAKQFGNYKISIHSGSDKFSIFPIVGEVTKGLFHEKTAGTSYLEAIRVIAGNAPALYRRIHKFALTRFEKDRASYHVTTNLAAIPGVDSLPDDELKKLMDDNDARQLIHITYGSVLQAKDENGKSLFRERIMKILDENEDEYFELLDKHISRHMRCLGLREKG